MPKIINTSARMVTIPVMHTVKNSAGDDVRAVKNRVMLPPLKLVKVSTEDWKMVKNIHMVKVMIDKGELLEGAAASREAVDDDHIIDELAKDLTDEERAKLG